MRSDSGYGFKDVGNSALMRAMVFLCVALAVLYLPNVLHAAPNTTVTSIVLTISPDQVVGFPLQNTAQILLLDSANHLVLDYDLAAHPITLVPASGTLTPQTLSDPALFSGGVINFSASQCIYKGPTGKIPVTATNGTVSSQPVIVSFNGYDVLKISDFKGDTIIEVYQGLPTTVKVAVRNNGSLTANANPSVRSYFSAGGGSVKVFFTPHANGLVDTVNMIDTAYVPPGQDTLVVELEARFHIGSTDFQTTTIAKFPVYVLTPASVSLTNGSLSPDSVYASENFSLGFRVSTTGFGGPIDSSRVRMELTTSAIDTSLALVYAGSPTYSTFVGGTITYTNLSAKVVPAGTLNPGWYKVRTTYRLFSGNSVFIVSDYLLDSLYIIPRSGPEYVTSSFTPDTVSAGAEASFQFKLMVSNGASLEVEPGTATFSIEGLGFSATVNLMVANNQLVPGENVITTEKVFMPANQLGNVLTVSAVLKFRRYGSPTYLTYTTDFNAQSVTVVQFPVVQIVSLSCVAPNGNKVNVEQAFRMRARIANQSLSAAEQLVVRLTSDGASIDSLLATVAVVPPEDTADVYFDVTAADAADPAEIFSADIVAGNAAQLPPLNNIALVAVQTPASLVLTHAVVGAPGGFVTHNAPFTLNASLINLGQASTSTGRYRLSSGGMDLGLAPEDTTGDISELSPVSLALTAPSSDTTVTLTFWVTSRPTDLNTTDAATIADTSFQVSVIVASPTARLQVQLDESANHPLPGDRQADLFSLRLRNSSGSIANTIRVDSVVLLFGDKDGVPIDANGAIDVAGAGFYEGSTEVAEASGIDGRVTLRFEGFELGAAENRVVIFRADVREQIDNSFSVRLDSAGISAHFVTGPSAGSSVVIGTATPGAPVLDLTLATSGQDLANSFMVENNPWHQETAPARFAYVQKSAGSLEFRIFTLTGELVHEQIYAEGSAMASPGSHVIEWNGHNDRGKLVFDGVYVVQLVNIKTGERARLKLAVLK